ncbi:hypothetical protein SHI21_19805 [Bacteriovorax sp. PP10]|uniref:Uncharacterized protein n=1 Tax=Bacteriovorax antarcticus TaxID=3088717 RepID=A0ABU5VZK6_9BACT|nr:hypothetical protein [Bacteriovorax sp. PP10]MEA9358492.1 hypothetical protein [Bacteriovorax sp. PP10]
MILTLKKINCIVISCFMIVVMSCSFFISVKYFSDDLATLESHNVFLASHLNYHERDSHHKDLDSEDEVSIGHSHTHRHSEGEEEHTHKHVNVVTFSEVILFQSNSLFILSLDIFQSIPKTYAHLFSDSYTLEILRPPIYS